MAEIKDKRMPVVQRKRQARSAQMHGADLVNGAGVGGTLPFVTEEELAYRNLLGGGISYNGLRPVDELPTIGSLPTTSPTPPATTPPTQTIPPVPTRPIDASPVTPTPISPVQTPVAQTAPPPPTPDTSGDAGSAMPGSTPPGAPPVTAPVTQPAVASPQPPVANAGVSQSITGTAATLDGSGSSDPQESQLTFSWTMQSGPSTPAINSPMGAVTQISNLVPGNYIFQLTVSNASGLSSTSTTSITVLPPSNSAATVNTGVTELNSGSTVLTTAPIGGSGGGPFASGGGAGGGGGAPSDASGADAGTPETTWQKWMDFAKANWIPLLVVGAAVAYVIFGKETKA